MAEKKMSGFRAWLDYQLKHNYAFNRVFITLSSWGVRVWGWFIPIDKKLIIFSAHTRKYNDSPRAIYEYMISHPEYAGFKYIWALEDPKNVEVPGPATKVKSDTLEYFKATLRAKYWVTCVNIERGLHYKKNSCVYLNTWHATPVKTMGNAAAGRKDYDFAHVDYFCIAGEYEKEIYKKDLNIREESVLKTGLPRNDELYHFTEEEKIAIKKKLNIPLDKKVILYAPTWRDSKDGGKTYAMKPPIDVKYWEKRLSDEYVVLFRTHQYTNTVLGIEFNDFCRDFCSYPVVNDLIKISDMMISDYSAILFDYCITERPLYCFGYDYDEFAKDRGFYVNIEEVLPMGVQRTQEELIDKILSSDYDEASQKTKAFKERFMKYGGNATETCVKTIFG